MPDPNAKRCDKCHFWYENALIAKAINKHTGEAEYLCWTCRNPDAGKIRILAKNKLVRWCSW